MVVAVGAHFEARTVKVVCRNIHELQYFQRIHCLMQRAARKEIERERERKRERERERESERERKSGKEDL